MNNYRQLLLYVLVCLNELCLLTVHRFETRVRSPIAASPRDSNSSPEKRTEKTAGHHESVR